MDTSNPSRPEGKRTSPRADARAADRAYRVSFSLAEDAPPLARVKDGATALTEAGRKVEECWRSLGEGRPYLEPVAVSIGPRTVQGILRLKPAHPLALSLPATARLFKVLSARALAGAGHRSAGGIWKKGFTEKPLDTLKQVVDARAALKARPKPRAKPKG